MPILSASNLSQLTYKLEGTYPTNFGVIQGGNGTKLNMLSETFDYTIKTESSKSIRSDRQVPDLVQVGATAQGGFSFEHQFKEYDAFIQAVVANDYTHYGTNGVSSALPAISTISGTAITFGSATAGADILTGLDKGQWFVLKPPAGATQAVKDWFASHPLRVSTSTAPTSTVLTVDASTPINTTVVGVSMAAGATIASSRAANGSLQKTYTIEVGHADVSLFRQYLGMICGKMSIKLNVGSIVTGDFEFVGKGMTYPIPTSTGMGTAVASQTYTPANATRGIFDIIEDGASITATTYIKSGEFSIDNSLRAQDAVGVFGSAGVALGTMQIMGKLEVYFADATMYNKLLSGAASSICIPILDVDGNGYVYYFPRIKYAAAKVNAGGLDQDNMLSMDFQALPDVTAGSPTLGKSVVVYRVGF